jgi:hypothetical protein
MDAQTSDARIVEVRETSQCISTVGPTRYTFYIQFITNQQPLHVLSTVCSSSGGTAYTTIGIFFVLCRLAAIRVGFALQPW